MKRILTQETTKKVGERALLKGWVDSIRSHGKIIFVDLRDRSGIAQLVFSPKQKDVFQKAQSLKPESVIEVEGKIKQRPASMINKEVATGSIEIEAHKLEILSTAQTPPLPLNTDGYEINEQKRLDYRYLDLRRERMKRNIVFRQKTAHTTREFLIKKGFVEIETPILTKSTPEGARDFVVPSRLQPGCFYALPQSPQQYKQLLMVAGFEKYFQIARCFRDEDPRADRAYGEFTQIDIELSFTDQEEILKLTEELFTKIVHKVFPEKEIKQKPFPRITYEQAFKKYGTDKPDLRKNKNNPHELAFCFIVDWPLFQKTKEKKITPAHHPFTAPKEQDLALLEKDPMKAKSWQHDFVLNGYEVGGGSIRITDPEVQQKIFEILGHSNQEIKTKFGHLLEAFQYGVPPHGGIALGFDRFLMVLLGEPSVREVMAFPSTAGGKTAVMNAPSEIDEEQLEELHLEIKKKKK